MLDVGELEILVELESGGVGGCAGTADLGA